MLKTSSYIAHRNIATFILQEMETNQCILLYCSKNYKIRTCTAYLTIPYIHFISTFDFKNSPSIKKQDNLYTTWWGVTLQNVLENLKIFKSMKKYSVSLLKIPTNVLTSLQSIGRRTLTLLLSQQHILKRSRSWKKWHYEPCFKYLEEKYRIPENRWVVNELLFGARGTI